MCTVSWSYRSDGYDLFFNRDELNSRAPELPPRLASLNGCAYVTTCDGDFGGSWLLVNDHGLTVCLLNDYANPWRPSDSAPRLSRGHLVLACAAVRTSRDVSRVLQESLLARAKPFHVLVMAPAMPPTVLHWGGQRLEELTEGQVAPPLSSSSFETISVIEKRIQLFAETFGRSPLAAAESLRGYHRQHDTASGAYSVLMRRPDAATRSITHVSVSTAAARLEYQSILWLNAAPVFSEPTVLECARSQGPV